MVILKHLKAPDLFELEKMVSLVKKSIIIQGAPHVVGNTWYVHFLIQDLDGLDGIKVNNQTTISNTKTTKVALKKDK